MVIGKEVRGVVEYNDGEFAEIQTVGIEGIEKNLLLCKIQLHRGDTHDSRQEFQHKYPVDTWLHMSTTIQVRS
jgi:hypothetical protein